MLKNFSKNEIEEMDSVFRLNLINSLSGFKSANLIGTKSNENENLAIISSVIHLGSDPALLGFIMRPANPQHHTFKNIAATEVYTINSVNKNLIKRAHYTSAKFDETTSEFDACKIKVEYKDDFNAPFVAESELKMAMKLEQVIPIPINGTSLIIGSIQNIYINSNAIQKSGQVDLNELNTVAISGLNRYHEAEEIGKFPYARVNEVPEFNS